MASQPNSPVLISALLLLLSISATAASFAETTAHDSSHKTAEKLTHFRVYWHDVVSGTNATAVTIVTPPPSNSSSSSFFGTVAMIDDALTVAPEPSSKLVGRAQGFYALASQEEVGLLMTMNFAFTEGKYNGSSITILGRNAISEKVREMPVVGGSGLFRFARGYVEARTHSFDPNTRDAVVEYNCYVLHY